MPFGPFMLPDPLTLGRFLDVAPDAIVILDPHERIAYVNAAAEHLFGYDADELRGETVEVVLPPRLRVARSAQHRECEYEKTPLPRPIGKTREVVGRHKGGTEILVEISQSTVTTDRGVWVMRVIRDLRERRVSAAERDHLDTDVVPEREDVRAEAQPGQQVSGEVPALADTMPAGVIVADARGTIVFSNPAARQLLGGAITGTVYGSDSGCTLHRPDGSSFPAGELPLTRAIERGETTHDVAILVRHPERPERVMLNTARPQRDSAGQITGAVVVFQDITQRKQAEQELAHLAGMLDLERSRLQSVLDSAINPIIYVDAETGHVQANPAAEQLFGHAIIAEAGRAQYTGQINDPQGQPISPVDLPSSQALAGETPSRQELLIERSDGARVPVVANAAPVRLPDGKIAGAVIVFQDISALKELQRAREEWTSVIAHDLRQPVTVILAYAGKLASEISPAASTSRAYTDHVLRSARQLNRMIADLRDLSRIDLRQLTLGRKPVELPALVRDIVERSAELTKDHAVSVRVCGAIPTLELDPDRVEQVVVNVLSNAAKYSDAGSPIEVQIAVGESDVEVAVTNRGPGIPPGELPAIFSRFYRARREQGGQVSGLGVGLYIAMGLVEAHGGRIWAESLPGEATTFRFTLPNTTAQRS
jgi:PAS domain S-box-containing protein